MSEKHLTEPPWKTLVSKQGVKDIGLQKALGAYARIDTAKEPARALETLTEISELALKLKKSCATKEIVVDHLKEMVKEVKKTTPALEARIKSPPVESTKPSGAARAKDEDEDEDEEKVAQKFKK